MKRKQAVLLIAIVVLLQLLPYLIGWISEGDQWVFSGFLIHPIDGNSYIAKMRQGWEGSWSFHLPFTHEASEGHSLFLFYLLLGHFSRLIGFPFIIVFHIIRVCGSILLFLTLYRFSQLFVSGHQKMAWIGFLLAVVGSGAGWMIIPTGIFTTDFWVAEAYPFLSAYTNPHFPIGMALLLIGFYACTKPFTRYSFFLTLFSGLLLAVIYPFGILLISVIGLVYAGWKYFASHQVLWQLIGLIPGGVFVVYQYWITITDPILNQWNEQNVTTTPPLWEFGISFSPLILLAFYFLWKWIRDPNRRTRLSGDQRNDGIVLLTIWFLCGILLAYAPFNLQRRILLGFYIPTAFLAAGAIEMLIRTSRPSIGKLLWPGMLILVIPTNLLILAAGSMGALTRESTLFLSRDELSAFAWIDRNSHDRAVIVSSPEIGLFLPGYTGKRVIYGHPFETIRAKQKQELITSFYSNEMTVEQQQNILLDWDADYLIYGPREQEIGRPSILDFLQAVFQQGNVIVYSTRMEE